MRIYSNMYEAIKETERELVEMGCKIHPESMQDKIVAYDPDYETIELQGYGYIITSAQNAQEDFKKLGGNAEYAEAESADRLSPYYLNPGYAWKFRKEIWEPFLHDYRFSYTYNTRFREQLPLILEELFDRPNTRQAIITMYDRHQDIEHLGGKARIPCSMYYQFLRRKRNEVESLDLIYTMRSCDFYTHLIYDVYLALLFQKWMAFQLNIVEGHFTHFIGSLHAYKKDYEPKGVF